MRAVELLPYRWFGRDVPADGWPSVAAGREAAWGLTAPVTHVAPEVDARDVSEVALWARLGVSDAASGGTVRSLVVPLATAEAWWQVFQEHAGPVSFGSFAARWAVDLELMAETAPGQQASIERPSVGDLLASLASADPSQRAEALRVIGDGVDLEPVDQLTASRVGATVALVSGTEGSWLVARVRTAGPNWLRPATPFVWYGPLAMRDGFRDAPALPGAWVRVVLEADAVPWALGHVLQRLPIGPPAWRSDFWADLLQLLSPTAIAESLGDGDAAVSLLARSAAGTGAFAPLLAAVGERRLCDPRRSFLPAEASRWAVADPLQLTPSRRAVAVALQARRLVEPWAVQMFCEARRGGRLDLDAPVVEAFVFEPLRRALLSSTTDVVSVVARLRAVEGAGGPGAVREVLDRLVGAGEAAPTELRLWLHGLPLADSDWLVRTSRGSVAGAFLGSG